MPALISDVSVRVTPRMWEKDTDVGVAFRGAGAAKIDTSRPIAVVGIFKRVTLEDVERSGGAVKGTIAAADAEKLIGTPVKGVIYTIVFQGFSTEEGETLVAAAHVTVSTSDCFEFDPPSSHTVKFTVGECTYLHAPGYSQPYANNCNICHGADLKGSNIGPSCFLCHGQLWPETPAASGSAGQEGLR
jgi:hypothetical protein